MKKLAARVVGAYLAVGATFGVVLWLSYLWGATWGMARGIGLLDHIGAGAVMMMMGTVGAALRALLWLPSLIMLLSGGMHDTFIEWLVPGAFPAATR